MPGSAWMASGTGNVPDSAAAAVVVKATTLRTVAEVVIR